MGKAHHRQGIVDTIELAALVASGSLNVEERRQSSVIYEGITVPSDFEHHQQRIPNQ